MHRPIEQIDDAPDMTLALEGARCSLWWRGTPAHSQYRVGAIGDFAAADGDTGTRLLLEACSRLAELGCTLAIGPMQRNTWRRYRLVTERGTEPPFFCEPDNPPALLECFRRAAFSVAASYVSALQEPIYPDENRIARIAHRTEKQDICIRPLDLRDIEGELRRLHPLCMVAFRNAFLFKPIGAEEFVRRHACLAAFMRPELTLIAEQAGAPIAFLLALPDALETSRGCSERTVIFKTAASLPGRANAGIAQLLAARIAATASALGYRRVIHALMREANYSANWSVKRARLIRRYALYGKVLSSIKSLSCSTLPTVFFPLTIR